MTKITIHAEMIDYKYEPGGYIVYIFRNLESKRWDTKYFMCTQVPNWDQPPIKLRDIGYLTIQEVIAGEDTWYDILSGQQVPYLYNNIYLVKFLPQKPADSENYTM